MTVNCEQCGKSNAQLVERTRWPDYSVERLRLCVRCRDKLGIHPPAPAYSGSSRTKYTAPSV